MYSNIKTCTLTGLDGHVVQVESDLSRGLPMFNIVGLPDISIKESKDRVRSAIKNSGFEFPLSRIIINLAPASLKKEGSQFDLSIATAILKSSGNIIEEIGEDTLVFGELSLDGEVNPVVGALPIIIAMREKGIKKFIIPYGNRVECGMISDVDIIPVKTLFETVKYFNKEFEISPYVSEIGSVEKLEYDLDFSDMKGQKELKRALEIAAAGGHNIIIVGSPGSGKTMAAERIPTILPDLDFEEVVEITKIHSISGLLTTNELINERPFRAPHHTASAVSLIGGGRDIKPGEISLAHNGVLYLDELPEFNKSVIETLRQPLESGQITITRASGSYTYPSKFILATSMNPCPCGYLMDPIHECTCREIDVDRYLSKVSNPILDRIDIHISVEPVKYEDLNSEVEEEKSETIRKRVNNARKIQKLRFGNSVDINGNMTNKDIKNHCKLDSESLKILEFAFEKYRFSARTYNKILKVARTIADLGNSEDIKQNHLLEGIKYRALDSNNLR